ncbi:MAG: hypothetical protein R3E63_09210 [Pseudomonadales bacterium]
MIDETDHRADVSTQAEVMALSSPRWHKEEQLAILFITQDLALVAEQSGSRGGDVSW